MQAAAVAKIMSKTPAGPGQATSVANDAAAADGVDFAALMAAQIQGADGAALPIVEAGAGDAAILPVAGDGATSDLKADVVTDTQATVPVDPALQAMALLPAFAPAVPVLQQAVPEQKAVLSAFSPDKTSGDQMVSVQSPADAGLAIDKNSVLPKEGAAEFAAIGKSLPSGDLKDGGAKIETFKLPVPSVEIQRTPDTIPVVMNADPARNVGEIKAPVGGVQTPVGASGWGDALGQKVVWMAGQHQQVAELHLNPPHLGPMEVRLTINNDQVSALFVSHQPAVREAIEAAMPRLREMFADSGMMLGNAMVSSDSLPQQQNSGQEGRSWASQSRSDFTPVDGYSLPVAARGVMSLNSDGRGLVDLFA
ncbi:MAG: flagellar hook-length control protein FliK [Sulfuricella sp.]